jgi:type IV secretory pathway VirB10-like protein
MKRTGFVIVAGMLFASLGAAQTQADAQAGGQAGGQTSVQAGKAQAQGSGSTAAASSASRQNGQANASLGSGAAINAELTAPIDSKKAKPGDPVAARTTEPTKSNGKTVIPKGSRLVGHVTEASARAKGDSESALGIVFDKAILKNGQEMPLNVAIQALASAQSTSSLSTFAGDDMTAVGSARGSAMGSGRAAGGGALGGVTSTAELRAR